MDFSGLGNSGETGEGIHVEGFTGAFVDYNGVYSYETDVIWRLDSTHAIKRENYMWVICSDVTDAWDTGVAQGAGGQPIPTHNDPTNPLLENIKLCHWY